MSGAASPKKSTHKAPAHKAVSSKAVSSKAVSSKADPQKADVPEEASPACDALDLAVYLQEALRVVQSFDEYRELIDVSPRISTPPLIAKLIEIRQELTVASPPDCAKPLDKEWLYYMKSAIEDYTAFLGGDVRGYGHVTGIVKDAAMGHTVELIASIRQALDSSLP